MEKLRNVIIKKFPSIYEESYTTLELIRKVIDYLNECIDQSNETYEYVLELKEWFNNLDVTNEVSDKLTEMEQDGTLANIINVQIFNDIVKRLPSFVNVKSLGAKGDGVADDTNSIQQALTNYDTVYFPEGNYRVKGTGDTIFRVKSGNRIIGANRDKTRIFVDQSKGDWNYMFLADSEADGMLINGVQFEDITLDVNINNTSITATNAFTGTGRVLIAVLQATHTVVRNCKLITNGFWTIRHKGTNALITDNNIIFDLTNNPLRNYDTSMIWCGGKNNIIKNNKMESNSKIVDGWWTFFAYTGIEAQGHFNIIDGNIINNTRNGILFTANTLDTESILPIEDIGAKKNKISNNIIYSHDKGIELWGMHKPSVGFIQDLDISNNVIELHRFNRNAVMSGITFYTGNPEIYLSGVVDGKQYGTYDGVNIVGNTIAFRERITNEFPFSLGDVGIRATFTTNSRNIVIKDNLFKNIGSYGILAVNPVIKKADETVVDNNNTTLSGLVITNNTFAECFIPIRMDRNVNFVDISNNQFVQRLYYTKGTNTIKNIELYNGLNKDVVIKNNSTMVNSLINPYTPKRFFTGLFDNNEVTLEDNKPSFKYETPNEVITIGTNQYIRMLDGTNKKPGSTFGTSVGSITETVTITSAGVRYIEVDKVANITPESVLAITGGILSINSVGVMAIESNRIHLLRDFAFNTDKSYGNLVGQTITFANNITAI